MSRKKLSVLILTIPERFGEFKKLFSLLEEQMQLFNIEEKVEICALMDNRSIEIAEKRNALLKLQPEIF